MADTSTNMPTTPAEMLEAVNAAIMNIAIGGQSYRIGTRSLTRADLKQLYAMKNDLMAQVAAENRSSLLDNTYVAMFDGDGDPR
ncbi:MAG: peptidylprolyl isomerase [Clostridium sp.]|nr:peptidylprolyl isomerase [Clostridium sp.]